MVTHSSQATSCCEDVERQGTDPKLSGSRSVAASHGSRCGMLHGARTFPLDERYGLTAQVKRSAVSVPSNIAEGRGRMGIRGFLSHLAIAKGSLTEVETQLLIAKRLGYLDGETADALLRRATHVSCLLAGLIRALKAKQVPANTG